MNLPTNLNGLFDNYNEAQFKDLMGEINKVAEWMATNYPEVTFRTDVNAKEKENGEGVLVCDFTVHTQREMSENDSLLKKYGFAIPKSTWFDLIKMGLLLRKVYPNLTQEISNDINSWYNEQKIKDKLLVQT